MVLALAPDASEATAAVSIQSPAIIEWLEERYPTRRCCPPI
jgi:hypothetical protein